MVGNYQPGAGLLSGHGINFMIDETDFTDNLLSFGKYVNAPFVAFLKRLGLDREFVRAEGAVVFDQEGRSFIDCVAGYGSLNLGHNPPKVLAAAANEISSSRPFNWPFISRVHARLAAKLADVTPGNLECSLIVNSGSEAVDSALKLVRLATGRTGVIATRGAWHGFTMGAMSISEPSARNIAGFETLLADVTHVPYGDAAAIEAAINANTGAVIIEPIQAESGAVVPPDGYLRELLTICHKKNVMVVFDEIKTGMGKTGRLFACEHENAVPDVLLMGKSLGGGAMPIGALVARRRLWSKFGYSFAMSASSNGGNAPACAAALAALELIESEQLCRKAHLQGRKLLLALHSMTRHFPTVARGVSGRGLLTALHTPSIKSAIEIASHCALRGVLVMPAFLDNTRILIEPPLCISDCELEVVIQALNESVEQIAKRTAQHSVKS